MSRGHHSPETREAIEQAIARGEDNATIIRKTGAHLQGVIAVRRAMDDLVEQDAFEIANQTNRRAKCRRGHSMVGRNVKQRPNGSRECRTCSRERDRDRRRAAGRAA